MASSNDFFIKFDSNAATWAASLKTELGEAKAEIASVQAAINALNRSAGGSDLRTALAASVPGATAGGAGTKHEVSALQSSINEAADEMKHVVTQLNVVVRGLELAQSRIADIPNSVSNALRSIHSTVSNLNQQTGGRGRAFDPNTPNLAFTQGGAFRHGDPMGEVYKRVRSAVNAGELNLLGGGRASGIANVRRSDIDRANFDRIVTAIRAQTRVISSGIKVSGTVGTEVSRSGRPSGTPRIKQAEEEVEHVTEELEDDLQALKRELRELDDVFKQVTLALTSTVDEGLQGTLNQITEKRDQMRAQVARMERDAEGLSRGEQRQQRRDAAAAERERTPVLSEAEHNRRLQQQALINSPADPSFMQQLGRGKERYGKADIRAMATALEGQGFPSGITTKDSLERMAEKVFEARQQYGRTFGDTIPEDLRTGRFIKDDRIGEETTKLLGDINQGLALQRTEQLNILRQNALGGGDVNQPPRGRMGYGSGILGGPSVLTRVATPEQVEAARQFLGELPAQVARQMAPVVRERAAGAGFDPYDPRHSRGIEGAGPLARAAQLQLGGMRTATRELDAQARKFYDLRDAMRENAGFIDRASGRLERGEGKETDPTKLEQARQRMREITDELQKMAKLAPLFQSAGFEAGHRRREEFAGIPFAQGVGTRQLYDQRVQAMEARRGTLTDYRAVRESTAEAVAGVRTAIRSRELIRSIPGMQVTGRGASRGLTHAEGLAPEDQRKLNQALTSLVAAQKSAFTGRARGLGGDELEAAERKLENSATHFANTVARLFGGLSPSLRSLTGRDPQIEENVVGEARRQRARDAAAEREARRFPTPTAPEELANAEALLARNSKEYAEAKKRLTQTTKALEKAERNEVKQLEALGAEQAEQYRAAARTASAAGGRAGGAASSLGRARLGELTPFESIGPLTERQTYFRQFQEKLRDAEAAEAASERQMRSIMPPGEGTQLTTEARREKGRAIAEKKALADAKARSTSAVARLRAEIEMVQREAAQGRTRKSIAQDLGLSPERIKGILGPARQPKEEAGVTQRTVAAANERVVALREERRALQQLPRTREQIKAMYQAGDAEGVATARRTRSRLREINQELEALGFGGGAGRGGPPRTARDGGADGGPGGGSNNILRQILAKLGEIHGTLKGGLRVSGRTSEEGETAAQRRSRAMTASYQELRAAGVGGPGGTDEERMAAIAAQRAREERLRPSDREGAYNQAHLIREQMAKRSLEQTRQQIHESLRYDQALQRLSSSTKAEIETLRRMNAEGRSNAEVVQQQVKVYAQMEQELRTLGVKGTGRRDAALAVMRGTTSEGTTQMGRAEFDEVARSARAQRGFTDLGSGWGVDAADGFGDGMSAVFGRNGFWSRVLASTGTFLVRNFTAGLVFGLSGALQQVLDQAIQTEATFVRVSSAMEATGKSTAGIRGDLQRISTDYGVQLNDVYETAAGLAGLFDNASDLAAGTRIVAQLQTISGGALNAAEAMGVLASTMSAFEAIPGEPLTDKLLPGGVEGVQHIADVLTVVQNNLGTNVEVTAEGVSRMAGLARQMSLSFEETAVFTAQIAKQTNQTGAAAGEQFSRIIAALQTGRGRGAAVSAFGAPLEGALAEGDYGKVFKVMIAGWDNLSASQKRNLTVSVAGQRQAAAFNALMNNGAKTLNTLAKAEQANGDAQDRMADLMQTLNKRLDVFGTQLQNLASNLVRSGLLNFLGVVLVVTSEVLDIINTVLTAFNDLADNNAVLGFLRNFVTLLVGAGLAFKVIQTGVAGMRGAIRSALPETVQQGLADRQTQRAAVRAGVARPGFGEFGPERRGVGAPLTRAVGFGLDRSVGIGMEATGRGLSGLSRKMLETEKEVGRFRAGAGAATRGLGTFTTQLGTGLRQFFQRGPVPFLDQRAANLQGRAGGYFARAAESRAILADQTRYAGYSGPAAAANQANMRGRLAAQGLSEAQIAQRTRAPQASLLRSAQVMEQMGRVSLSASNGVGKLSSGMQALGSSGIGADLALGALTITIGAMIAGMEDNRRRAKDLQEGFDAAYGKDRGKTSAVADQAAYVGRVNEDFQREFAEISDEGVNNFSAAWQGFKARTSNGLRGVFDSEYAYSRSFGTSADLSETYGLSAAQDLLAESQVALEEMAAQPGVTGARIRALNESIADDISRRANDIMQDESLSAQQKQAAIANLQQVGKALSDQAFNLSAVADGITSTIGMSADAIQRVQDTVAAISSVQGQVGLGGLDLAPLFGELIADTGAQEGGETKRILDRLTSGRANSVDIAFGNVKLLREEVINLQNSWQSKLDAGLPDEAADIKGQLLSTLAQLGQANDQAIAALLENADLVSAERGAQGDLGGAMDAYGDAIQRAGRVFRQQAQDFRKLQRQTYRAELEAWRAARFIKNLDLNPFQRGGIEDLMTGGDVAPKPQKPDPGEDRAGRQRRRRRNAQMSQMFQQMADLAIFRATKDITLQIAQTSDAGLRAALEAQRAAITEGLLSAWNQGEGAGGISDRQAARWGDLAIDQHEMQDAQVQSAQSEQAAIQAEKDRASQARQDAAALLQARIGVRAAWADARGDAVASARAQVAMAQAAMGAARAELAAATTASEVSQAQAAVYAAQAQLIAANAAVQQAQIDLVRSQYDVSIALAEAAGKTVLAARRTLAQARASLAAALRRSGGERTAEVNAARAEVIRAEAATRDAKLQDELDTIDFNLEMGRITQASAIAAMREILRTHDLTRQQRRDLLLQIKGMQDEMADSQWNFGDIQLPTPYQMRRYIEQRKANLRGEIDKRVFQNEGRPEALGAGIAGGSVSTTYVQNTFEIDGADIGTIRRIIREVVGGNVSTTTTAGRRR